jgi:hypothetical protein
VKGSVPLETKGETARRVRAWDGGALTTLGSFACIERKRMMVINLDRLALYVWLSTGFWTGYWIYWPLIHMAWNYKQLPSLISTIHKSPQQPLSLFQPAVSSPAVPWKQLLTVVILQLHALKSPLNGCSLPTAPFFTDSRTEPTRFLATRLHGPSRQLRCQQHLCCCMRIRCHANVLTEPLPGNECCFRSVR